MWQGYAKQRGNSSQGQRARQRMEPYANREYVVRVAMHLGRMLKLEIKMNRYQVIKGLRRLGEKILDFYSENNKQPLNDLK